MTRGVYGWSVKSLPKPNKAQKKKQTPERRVKRTATSVAPNSHTQDSFVASDSLFGPNKIKADAVVTRSHCCPERNEGDARASAGIGGWREKPPRKE